MEEYKGGVGRTECCWPWERFRKPASTLWRTFPSHYSYDRHNFASKCLENEYPDIDTKISAIKASASVVSLVSYLDGEEIIQGTGTIIEEEGAILTSAKLVAYPTNSNEIAEKLQIVVHLWDGKSYEAQLIAHNFYYGLAVVKIQENVTQLKPSCLTLVDDCASIDLSELPTHDYKDFRIRHHSKAYRLVPGSKLIVLGRNFIKPYEIMAAPGEFSIRRCRDTFECKELFRATCLIAEIGRGGPVVNCNGEVVGVASFDYNSTPFVPTNVALKWWENFKKGKLSRPFLGMELANLHNSNLQLMEKVIRKFTNNVAGVFVEKVQRGSSAHTVGICPNDIIVECCGIPIRSFLELYDMMWDKIGDDVKMVVLRASADVPLDFEIKAVEARQSNKRTMSSEAEESAKRTRSCD